jgi:hypothetical protein
MILRETACMNLREIRKDDEGFTPFTKPSIWLMSGNLRIAT